MTPEPPPAEVTAEPAFEDAMQRLDEIVETMEGERMALDDMVRFYEEGIHLVRQCRRQIDQARQRVERVNQLLEEGSGELLSAFEPQEGAEEAVSGSESRGVAAGGDGSPVRGVRKAARKMTEGDDGGDEIRLF
jgi:exodeoxyribonuclease VII small subunit